MLSVDGLAECSFVHRLKVEGPEYKAWCCSWVSQTCIESIWHGDDESRLCKHIFLRAEQSHLKESTNKNELPVSISGFHQHSQGDL